MTRIARVDKYVFATSLSVRTPKSGDAVGLYQCLKDSFSFVGVQDSDWQKKLIGFGCDGTNVNIADGGVKGYLRRDLPWIEVIWCLAHRKLFFRN